MSRIEMTLAIVSFLLTWSCNGVAQNVSEAVRAATTSCADAWLTNDADAVMATFVAEPADQVRSAACAEYLR